MYSGPNLPPSSARHCRISQIGKSVLKRNTELIREILLKIEGLPIEASRFDVPGVDDSDLLHNVDLLVDAGFIKGAEVKWAADGIGSYIHLRGPLALTWHGHDFLDAIRVDSIWDQAKRS